MGAATSEKEERGDAARLAEQAKGRAPRLRGIACFPRSLQPRAVPGTEEEQPMTQTHFPPGNPNGLKEETKPLFAGPHSNWKKRGFALGSSGMRMGVQDTSQKTLISQWVKRG